MQKDLTTSIAAAIAGILIAFFVTRLIIPPIEDVSFKTVDGASSASLDDPDPNVFNYKALNPTVEVYVGGDCEITSESGECLDIYESAKESN